MKISEIFRSIQGEGTLAGTPSVFVRTSVCNLRCIWCDTPYTSWSPELHDLTVEAIAARVMKLAMGGDEPVRHVVITGGEPFLQARELDLLCRKLSPHGFHITIETNATIFKRVDAHLISMSPKLRNSAPPDSYGKISDRHEKRRINVAAIRSFLEHYHTPPSCCCQVKFVVEVEEDLDEIERLENEALISRQTILLMPQATDPAGLAARSLWLERICRQRGYRLSPRLHIELYGNQRGV